VGLITGFGGNKLEMSYSTKAWLLANLPRCVRNPFSLGLTATVLICIFIALIVKEVADPDESFEGLQDAFMISLPWGGSLAGVWLVLLIMAQRNVGGPGAVLKVIIWIAVPVVGFPLFSIFIAILLLLAPSSVLPPSLFAVLTVCGVVVSYSIYDPDFED